MHCPRQPSRFALVCLLFLPFPSSAFAGRRPSDLADMRVGRLSVLLSSLASVVLLSVWTLRSASSGSKLDYRDHLNSFHRATPVAANMGFDHIYVVSLPHRADRRAIILKLAEAQNLRITFVDAISADSPVIHWIAERVAEVRRRKRGILSKVLRQARDRVGGQDIDSGWLLPSVDLAPAPNLRLVADPFYKDASLLDFPPLTDQKYGGEDWTSFLEHHIVHNSTNQLIPQLGINITELMHDSAERYPNRQTNAGTLACWYSHMQAIRQLRSNQDKRALILEDDVDFEWDIAETWAGIAPKLPQASAEALGWHSVFLGHCWGRESECRL